MTLTRCLNLRSDEQPGKSDRGVLVTSTSRSAPGFFMHVGETSASVTFAETLLQGGLMFRLAESRLPGFSRLAILNSESVSIWFRNRGTTCA